MSQSARAIGAAVSGSIKIVVGFLAARAADDVPIQLNYQDRLTDPSGNPEENPFD